MMTRHPVSTKGLRRVSSARAHGQQAMAHGKADKAGLSLAQDGEEASAGNGRVQSSVSTFFKRREYSMPQRVGHASLGNLEVLHRKANGSTIVFTHCEQKNEII